jgi:hypothetical protein
MKRIVKADIEACKFASKICDSVAKQTLDESYRQRLLMYSSRLINISHVLSEAISQGTFAFHRRIM